VSSLQFRFAATRDIPEVVALVQSAYRGQQSREGWTTEADLIDGQRIDESMLTTFLARPQSFVVLAETDRIVGCCELTLHHSKPATAYFGMFAVDPTEQSTGIGRALMNEAEALAIKELGATAIELVTIHLRTDVISMYERRGFSRTGETVPFPYGDERYGTPRREDLYLVALRKDF
jgi:ribosomal protein S18 acetylase RimI-like enzyme